MKKALNITAWILLPLMVLALLAFSAEKQQQQTCLQTNVNVKGHVQFIRNADVIERLNNQALLPTGKKLGEVDVLKMEKSLIKMAAVKKVEVFQTIDAQVNVVVEQRMPICRLLLEDGSSLYLDTEGKLMPFSQNYTARVLVLSGHIDAESLRPKMEPGKEVDSLLLDDIFALSKYVFRDPFWKSQLVQVHVNEGGEFELVPRVGRHLILLGDGSEIKDKLENLYLWYQKGTSPDTWNQYDTINLKYKDQIVCSKK